MKPDQSTRKVYALIVPRIAYARMQRDNETSPYYFDSLYVRASYRRRGIGTRLLLHAITLVGLYPELDIRKISYVAQRIATKAGYTKIANSTRYLGCSLWKNFSLLESGQPQFNTKTVRIHQSSGKVTETHYLIK